MYVPYRNDENYKEQPLPIISFNREEAQPV